MAHEKNVKIDERNQELGRSKGEFLSKLLADALTKFFVTAGQRPDYVEALDLIKGRKMLIADEEYDANYMIEAAQAVNATTFQ